MRYYIKKNFVVKFVWYNAHFGNINTQIFQNTKYAKNKICSKKPPCFFGKTSKNEILGKFPATTRPNLNTKKLTLENILCYTSNKERAKDEFFEIYGNQKEEK